MRFDKLVRDRIPGIIRARGGKPRIHVAGAAEYRKRLRQKLLEESREYARKPGVDELADVLEVVYSLCRLHGTTASKLESVRKAKARERGSFRKGIVLESA